MVSTRFCTPVSLRLPPAAVAWRYRSIRQPIVALSTYVTVERSTSRFFSPLPIRSVTAPENSDSSGYINRLSCTRTMATPCSWSVVRFILTLRF